MWIICGAFYSIRENHFGFFRIFGHILAELAANFGAAAKRTRLPPSHCGKPFVICIVYRLGGFLKLVDSFPKAGDVVYRFGTRPQAGGHVFPAIYVNVKLRAIVSAFPI
jgi:hypothetical protein